MSLLIVLRGVGLAAVLCAVGTGGAWYAGHVRNLWRTAQALRERARFLASCERRGAFVNVNDAIEFGHRPEELIPFRSGVMVASRMNPATVRQYRGRSAS